MKLKKADHNVYENDTIMVMKVSGKWYVGTKSHPKDKSPQLTLKRYWTLGQVLDELGAELEL